MTEVDRYAARLRNRLLFAFNSIALLIVLVYVFARLRGVDTLAGSWVLCWGIALGLWLAAFITFLLTRVRVADRSVAEGTSA